MDRETLLTQAKQRALAYVDKGDLTQALASMLSDMDGLPGITREGNDLQGAVAMTYAIDQDYDGMRRWIEGIR